MESFFCDLGLVEKWLTSKILNKITPGLVMNQEGKTLRLSWSLCRYVPNYGIDVKKNFEKRDLGSHVGN
jgi:hypothetical protein